MPVNSSYPDPFYSPASYPVRDTRSLFVPTGGPTGTFEAGMGQLPQYFKQIGSGFGQYERTGEQQQTSQFGGVFKPNPLEMLSNYIAGRGALSVSDETGGFQFNPGGGFNVGTRSGFSVSGNPLTQSIGVNVPVNVAGTKGIVGATGSWNPADPSIQANVAFGQKSFPIPTSVSSQQAESAVAQATAPWQLPPDKTEEPTARQLADQLVDQYRSSGGRSPDSPSSWF